MIDTRGGTPVRAGMRAGGVWADNGDLFSDAVLKLDLGASATFSNITMTGVRRGTGTWAVELPPSRRCCVGVVADGACSLLVWRAAYGRSATANNAARVLLLKTGHGAATDPVSVTIVDSWVRPCACEQVARCLRC